MQAQLQQFSRTILDPDEISSEVKDFEMELSKVVIGQPDIINAIARFYQMYTAGLHDRTKPIANMLLLGQTGVGKTLSIEAAAEYFFGDRNALVKINCAEFQHPHEISKLIGAPPGFIGHGRTSPHLTQKLLEFNFTDQNKFSFVLFDEIEKASSALWDLMLGIMDKATLTIGTNQKLDFSRSIVVMTSNLGAREISAMFKNGMGFAPKRKHFHDNQIHRVACGAARKKFSPEFMNRLNKVVVFNSLNSKQLRTILENELYNLGRRINKKKGWKLRLHFSESCKEYLLARGTDAQYGARELQRAIERYVSTPLANLIASHQIGRRDRVSVNFNLQVEKLEFRKLYFR